MSRWLNDYGTAEKPVPPAPLRLVVRRQWTNGWRGGWLETLECGHQLVQPPSNFGTVRRRCHECAASRQEGQDR
jgi:hypothetical protein